VHINPAWERPGFGGLRLYRGRPCKSLLGRGQVVRAVAGPNPLLVTCCPVSTSYSYYKHFCVRIKHIFSVFHECNRSLVFLRHTYSFVQPESPYRLLVLRQCREITFKPTNHMRASVRASGVSKPFLELHLAGMHYVMACRIYECFMRLSTGMHGYVAVRQTSWLSYGFSSAGIVQH
jgi:hypothetical protein